MTACHVAGCPCGAWVADASDRQRAGEVVECGCGRTLLLVWHDGGPQGSFLYADHEARLVEDADQPITLVLAGGAGRRGPAKYVQRTVP